MSVSSTTNTVSYTGDASTTEFATTFTFQGTGSTSEIVVIERVIATGVETTQTYTTHYTVTGGSGSTGTVIAASAPAATVQWHIQRSTTQTQTIDYVTNDPFPADTHELGLDRAVMISQEQQTEMDKAFQYPATYTGGASNTMPEPIANAFLVFNSDGDALTTSATAVAQLLSSDGTVLLPYYSFSADPDTGIYRIGANNLGISVGGVLKLDIDSSGVNGAIGQTSAAAGSFTALAASGTSALTGTLTMGGDIVSDTDSTDDLGTTGVRWANLFVDDITTTATATFGTSITLATGATVTGIEDSDSLASDSNTLLATQQSIKAYVDNATAASAVWSDVVYLTNADSPKTLTSGDQGKFFVCDTSSGAITINLPAISGLASATSLGIKKSTSDANSVTVTPNGSEEIDETAGSVTITVLDAGRTFISDADKTPDSWTTAQFGSTGGNMNVDNFTDSTNYTSGTTTQLTMTSAAASENDMIVTFDGVTQHHNTYSISGTTVTFDTAIPLGTDNVEIRWGITLAINTPGSATVGASELAADVIDGLTEVVVAIGDSFMLSDVGDSGDPKRDTMQGILDLYSATDATLTGGYQYTPTADGAKASGTYTPTYAGSNIKTITGTGSFTIAPQSGDGVIVVQYTVTSGTPTVTTSGFDKVTGDSITTTGGDDFLFTLTVVGTFSHLHVVDVS